MSQARPPEEGRPPPSIGRHRRESFWQITLPMLVVLLAVGLAFALTVLAGPDGIAGVASWSLVLVSIPLLFIGVLALAFFVALLVGVGWLLRHTPRATGVAQDLTARASETVQQVLQRVTGVAISAAAGLAMARRFLGSQDDGGSESDGASPDPPSVA